MATPKKRTSYGQKALDLAAARADVIDEVGKKSEVIEQLKKKHARELETAQNEYVQAVADATEKWSTRELREEFDIVVTKPVKEELKRRRENTITAPADHQQTSDSIPMETLDSDPASSGTQNVQ
ncbi:hypothetical protein [Natronoglycomyces albus]|uniref:Uncharacterized protein n=1 Tax=Natronoglycomyces albus TaxID=2811108 RepID=A0A895XUL7_9ACTN|nr:hypothetical protein [Natronoglycomyces albus]QSB07163.1 hypothetical protein JQS30_17120 [Natronoglycomyces albus]